MKKMLLSSGILPDESFEASKVVVLSKNELSGKFAESLKGKEVLIVDNIWSGHSRLMAASRELAHWYEKMVPRIAQALNRIHGVDYPATFWEIPLGAWLWHYLHLVYERYCKLNHIAGIYGKDALVLCYREDGQKLLQDDSDWTQYYSVDDGGVSALYAAVAEKMGIAVNPVRLDSGQEGKGEQGPQAAWDILNSCNGYLYRLGGKVAGLLGGGVLLYGKNMTALQKLSLMSKTGGWLFWPKAYEGGRTPVVERVDRELLRGIPWDDDFERVVVELLPAFMPQSLLEHCRFHISRAKPLARFKIYFSLQGPYDRPLFLYASAFGRMNGGRLVSCQHGGAEGQYCELPTEFLKRKLSDYYLTWGWSDNHYPGAKVVPMPQPKLAALHNTHSSEGSGVMIYVSTSHPKHPFVFYSFDWAGHLSEYLEWKFVFLGHLERGNRETLLYRPPHLGDWGFWQRERAIVERYPEIKINGDGVLVEILKKAKICVCDFPGTSMLESLVINTPTVLFWNNWEGMERESIKPVFDILRNAGILFHDPAAAAKALNHIMKDVERWWLDEERQRARRVFLKAYVWSENRWCDSWASFFKGVLAESRS